MCENFIKNILIVFNGDKELLKKFYWSEHCGSGSTEYYGWFWNIIKEKDPRDTQTTRVKYDFKLNDADLTIDIGPVGVVSEDGILKIVSDYFVEPAKPRGWKFDGKDVAESDIEFTAENYLNITYAGKQLHEHVNEWLKKKNPYLKIFAVFQETMYRHTTRVFLIGPIISSNGNDSEDRAYEFSFFDGQALMQSSGYNGVNRNNFRGLTNNPHYERTILWSC
jgi:hypothetical protein